MGRYFQTSNFDTSNNYMFTPPWELIAQKTAEKQQLLDTSLASLEMFNNLNVEHLQGEDDIYNLNQYKKYYEAKANEIAEAIKQGGDPNKYQNSIKSLAKELQDNMMNGDLSKIRQSALALQAWEKENEKYKEKDPAYYTHARNVFMSRYLKNGGNSLVSQWQGETLYNAPDWDKIQKSVDSLIASETNWKKDVNTGNWITTTGQKVSEVTVERTRQRILSSLLADPSNSQYLQQAQRLGYQRYYDENGQLDPTSPGLLPILGIADSAAYSKIDQTQELKVNPYAMEKVKHQNDIAMENLRHEHAKDLEDYKNSSTNIGKLQAVLLDENATEEQKNQAREELNRYFGGTVVDFKRPIYESFDELKDSGNKAQAIDYINKMYANSPATQKLLQDNLNILFDKNKTTEDYMNAVRSQYLKTPAGKREFFETYKQVLLEQAEAKQNTIMFPAYRDNEVALANEFIRSEKGRKHIQQQYEQAVNNPGTYADIFKNKKDKTIYRINKRIFGDIDNRFKNTAERMTATQSVAGLNFSTAEVSQLQPIFDSIRQEFKYYDQKTGKKVNITSDTPLQLVSALPNIDPTQKVISYIVKDNKGKTYITSNDGYNYAGKTLSLDNLVTNIVTKSKNINPYTKELFANRAVGQLGMVIKDAANRSINGQVNVGQAIPDPTGYTNYMVQPVVGSNNNDSGLYIYTNMFKNGLPDLSSRVVDLTTGNPVKFNESQAEEFLRQAAEKVYK